MSGDTAIVEKEKNPKRVAAGKKLAERNKMYKEHFQKTGSMSKTKPAETVHTESTPSDTSSSYYVIGVIVLAVAGIMYYQSSSSAVKPAVRQAPKPVEEPKSKPSRPSRLIKV